MIQHHDRFALPLATCQLLISPSDTELTADPTLVDRSLPADLAHVQQAAKEWRDSAATHPDSVTFFYFAGHGLQRKHLESVTDQVLLLRDFGGLGGPILQHGFSAQELIDAMAPGPGLPKIGRSQYFFFDACRNQPRAFKDFENVKCATLLDVLTRTPRDDRNYAIYYTTEPDRAAYAHPSGVTFFVAALLRCLEGGAGERGSVHDPTQPEWNLTLGALERGVRYYLSVESAAAHLCQRARPVFTMPIDTVFCRLAGPPHFPLTVSIDPASARDSTQVLLLDAHNEIAWSLPLPIHPHPCSNDLAVGYYSYHATFGQTKKESGMFSHDRPDQTILVRVG
jgi:hypothetical protein